jgi:PAS domain S-box-containing protein
VDRNGRVLSANRAARSRYGLLPGSCESDWVTRMESAPERISVSRWVAATEAIHSQVSHEFLRDSQRLETTVWPVFDTDDRVDLLAVHVRDITARWEWETALRQSRELLEQRVSERTAELAHANAQLREEVEERTRAVDSLRKSELRFRNLAENSLQGILVTDRELRPLFANGALASILGFESTEQMLSLPSATHLLEASSRQDFAARAGACLEAGREPQQVELLGHRADGRDVALLANMAAVLWDDQTAVQVVLVSIDARKRAERERQLLATAVDQAEEGVAITTQNSLLVYANRSYARLLGASSESAQGRHIEPHGLLSDGRDLSEVVLPLLAQGRSWSGRYSVAGPHKELIWRSVAFSPISDGDGRTTHHIEVCRDITKQLLLEQELAQAQKMESIGRLAGGIAHDFNNILAVITSFSELLLERPALGEREREQAQVILDSAGRAAALTRQLLAFSRKQVLHIEPVRLNDVVTGIEKMLRRMIGEDVDLHTVLGSELHIVHADKSQIEQIVMNLAVNARDAMPEGGSLTIETRNVRLDPKNDPSTNGATGGGYVMLACTDSGEGMDADTQARIFEPFFTTKPLGKGTGLGLATVYGIVKQLGGTIEVESEPGNGAVFRIHLPATLDGNAGPGADVAASVYESSAGAHVLVVEDDPSVRRAAHLILESHGYVVVEANDGAAAVARLQRADERIDIVLSDVVMPGMSASEFLNTVEAIRPVPIVFMSGYADDSVASIGLLEGKVPFLGKPFSKHSLLQKVGEVLRVGKPSGSSTLAPPPGR